ncbi:META domain-containing protein [Georgenia subflava]|uniref:META domain-containing protein n=1 Tax=Georgenia subflava TaxID=1622177 RepID=A0A6N7EHV0_9MICO|nr:META domain-containing protein [Georgenia subflava]MPV36558.1 META domain-containing protein [Georgenia subflava]
MHRRSRKLGVWRTLGVVLLGAALLSGCAGAAPSSSASPGPGNDGESPRPDSTPSGDDGTTEDSAPSGDGATSAGPLGLVNLWRVGGVATEQPETWLRIDVGALQLWRDCGMIDGSWAATSTLFLAAIHGGSGGCLDDGFDVPWLEQVTGYRPAEGGWELIDRTGGTVATLTIDGAPEPIDTAAEFYAEPPEITDDQRDRLRLPEPLPGGLPPATAADLVGAWVPTESAPTSPYLELAADGTWVGSDGCNTAGGRWSADDSGALLTTAGPMTLIWCEGAPVPSWIATARSATFDGRVLTLLDRDAEVLGELVRR